MPRLFKVLNGNNSAPTGYQKITCHMIVDAKMEDFHRKACFVAGGHMAGPPTTVTYVSIVSHDTVHHCLMLATPDDLEAREANIQNVYITVAMSRKGLNNLGPQMR